MKFKVREDEKFPERCLVVRLIKDINNKRLKGKEISICNLPDGKYNLRIDNNGESQFKQNITKREFILKLFECNEGDKPYVSLINRRNY